MGEENLVFGLNGLEILNLIENQPAHLNYDGKLPEITMPLLWNASNLFSQIEEMLYTVPSFVNAIKSTDSQGSVSSNSK